MRSSNRSTNFKSSLLRLESLEQRDMLAGDVAVSISNGDLRVHGDSDDNALVIASTEEGIRLSGEDGTLVNGSSEPLILFAEEGSIPDDLHVALGSGGDRLELLGLQVGDDINVNTSRGDDSILLSNVTAGDRIKVYSSSGDDQVVVEAVAADGYTARDLVIYDSSGDNTISVRNIDLHRDLYVRTGSGEDKIVAQGVETGDDLRLYSTTGNDQVAIIDSHVADDTVLNTGYNYNFGSEDRDSALILNSVHGDRASISLGASSDFLGLDGLTIEGSARVYAGRGDDSVSVSNSAFAKSVRVDGGRNTDGLEAIASDFAQDPDVRNFESEVEDSAGRIESILASLEESGALQPRLASITDLVVGNPDFSILEEAVIAAGLADTLAQKGSFTVFAPLNSAFESLPEGTLSSLLEDPTGALKDILLYHTAGEEIFAADIVQVSNFETLLGSRVSVDVTAEGVVLNGNVNVTVTDIEASNGVVHVIDAVLLPPPSIADIVIDNDNFSILEQAVVAAGLATTLDSSGDFTVFAPTNSAFEALPPELLQAALDDPEGLLTEILSYHVVAGEAFSSDVSQLSSVETLLGSRVSVTATADGIILNDSVLVTTADIIAANGVVHVIDAVLIPPGSITEIVVDNDNFSTLEAAVVAAGLAETLDSEGDFTVFAPTNAAFDLIDPAVLDQLLADPTGALQDILLYHVADGEILREDLAERTSVPTKLGPNISVAVDTGNVVLNGNISVSASPVYAANGIIHVIDAVLLPPDASETSITDLVANNPDFETLFAALEATGLNETLASEGNFTVFAPTDDAFEKLPRGLVSLLTRFAPRILESILLYHTVDGAIPSSEIVTQDSVSSLLGRNIDVEVTEGGVILNGNVKVITTDIQASNGVIHVIDTVLLPIRLFR
ncbi:MAG: hypothetical protein CMJ77_15775 [Planctomycetaceae bacterium]|nr:hypothetical protein [Planctomycetaceae bacterium]